jgi:uncharacterized protein (DUF4415 family)
MKNAGETKTDFEKLAAMVDGDIDCSDIPELTREFLDAVEWKIETPVKEQITLRVDKPVLDYYKKTGKNYHKRMNTVLRVYAEMAQREKGRKRT